MSNVLVIGGAGFIGSHAVDKLMTSGHKIMVVDNLSSGHIRNLSQWSQDDYILKIADVNAPIGFRRLVESIDKFSPTHVIDFAAEPYIPESFRDIGWSHDILISNINLAVNSVRAVLNNNIERYVYLSTSEVYGTAVGSGPMSETHRLNPQSTYATSKLAAERVLMNWYYEHGLPTVIIRQFNTYGPRSTWPYVIPEIIQQMIKQINNDKITIRLGNIFAERDFSYVADAAETITQVLFSDKIITGDVYNSALGGTRSVKDIVYDVARVLGIEGNRIELLSLKERLRPNDVERLWGNSYKLNSALYGNSRRTTSFTDGLHMMVEDYNKNGGWLWETD